MEVGRDGGRRGGYTWRFVDDARGTRPRLKSIAISELAPASTAPKLITPVTMSASLFMMSATTSFLASCFPSRSPLLVQLFRRLWISTWNSARKVKGMLTWVAEKKEKCPVRRC